MRLSGTKTGSVNTYKGLGNQLYDLGGARPTLDLNFANNNSLADSITGKTLPTFTRASSATYVDGDGLIKTSPVNVATLSNDWSFWTQATATLTVNSAQGPFGSNDAATLSGSGGYINRGTFIKDLQQGTQYTFSLFIKNINATSLQIELRSSSLFSSPSPLIDVTSQLVTDEWTRVSGTFAPDVGSGDANARIYITGEAQIYGFQVEEGSTATAYIPTTSTISGAPRFDHDPATGESLGLLIEESRTNLVKYSEPDNRSTTGLSEWFFSNLNPNTEITKVEGPDGVLDSASEMQLSSGSTYDAYLKKVPVNSGQAYTFSAWVKLGTATNFAVHINNTFAWDTIPDGQYTFDSSDGLNTDTFVKISLTFISPTTEVNVHIGRHMSSTQVQQTQGTVTIWGCQLELGSFGTSTIITSGSTVTRAADVAEISGNKFAKTNLLQYSERFDDSAWIKVNATITPNSTTAPDSSLTADTLTINTGSTYGRVDKRTLGLSSGVYTLSYYIKDTANQGTHSVEFLDSSNNSFTSTPSGIVGQPNSEWRRIDITLDCAAEGLADLETIRVTFRPSSSPADGTNTVNLWGAQLEEGDELTEYTPSVESFTSRASSATYVDDTTGLITTTPVNLMAVSEEFDQWTIAPNAAVTANAAAAPDGTFTADRVSFTTGYIFRGASGIIKPSTIYTISIYVKDNGTDFYKQTLDDKGFGGLRYETAFTFSTKTFTTSGSGAANMATPIYEEVGDGWFRIIQTITVQATANSIIFMNRFGTQDNFLWGAQIEEGSTATTYIPTTSTISGAPRYENGELLLEEARTNLLSYSGSIGPGNDGFVTNATTVTTNADTAPDGTTTATRLSSDVGFAYVTESLTSGVDYVFSFYAKTSTDTSWTINTQSDPFIDKTVTVVPGEWTRVDLAFTATATGSQQLRFVKGGGLTGDILIWGAQLEEGSFPTSYIPTTGTTVTRAADVSTSALGVDSWYNQDEGTVFSDVGTLDETSSRCYVFSDGTIDQRIGNTVSDGNNFALFFRKGAVTSSLATNTTTAPAQIKYGLAYKSGDSQGAIDGVLETSSTNNTPVGINQLSIGSQNFSSDGYLNGHIKRLAYFNTRLPDATLQNITT